MCSIARRARLVALAALLAVPAGGAAPAAAPAPLPTEAFFRAAQNEMVKLSPGGRYLAVTVPETDRTRLAIIDLAGMRITAVFAVTQQHYVNEFLWIDPQRVAFNTYKKVGSLDFAVADDEWFAGNADQSRFFSIGPLEQVLGRDRERGGCLLAARDDIYSVDTFASGGTRWHMVSATQLGHRLRLGPLVLDRSNRARVATVYGESRLHDVKIRARGRGESSWIDARTLVDPLSDIFQPLAMAEDQERVYVLSNDGAATSGLVLWEPKTGRSELVFRHPEVDVDRLIMSADGRTPIGVSYNDGLPRVRYFDDRHPDALLYRDVAALFPDERISFTSFSDDGARAVVLASSDTDPGQFYLLDVKAGTLAPLVSRRPWIEPKRMAPMQPIALKARDGTSLHGYLTLPPGAAGTRAPMIVLVHGGPHLRDRWGFDPEVQFLASRGYAVLQVNFRGSSGYGVAFMRDSVRRWGLEPQDDVTDATRWAIAQGIADPDRICIYGSSYGGYSALMGVIREPRLYRCAAANAGVYDLAALKYEGDVADQYWGTEYWQRELGKDPQIARQNSPVNLAGRIRVPVFLAHGGKDPRAPVSQFKAMKSRLEASGVALETLLLENGGHGFTEPEHLIEYYDHLAAFFARNTAPKAPAPPAN